MKIDWFDFWLIFSGILLFILLVGVSIRFFHWLSFRKELSYIKDKKIGDIVKKSPQKDLTLGEQALAFKKEIDLLKKDVCFDMYQEDNDLYMNGESDFESSLESLLDGKILDLIKEKDLLLTQKDVLIGSIDNRNKQLLKEIVNKTFFLLNEKDKILAEKNAMISYLRMKIQEIALIDTDSNLLIKMASKSEKKDLETSKNPQEHKLNNADFLNVNHSSEKK